MGRLVLQAAQEVSDDSRVSSLRRLSLGLHVAKTTLVSAAAPRNCTVRLASCFRSLALLQVAEQKWRWMSTGDSGSKLSTQPISRLDRRVIALQKMSLRRIWAANAALISSEKLSAPQWKNTVDACAPD